LVLDKTVQSWLNTLAPTLNLHIGFDDTDSPRGGCTTYIAALLVEKLITLGVRFVDYPNLIRLNPNVPWKTRGNGALCLRTKLAADILDLVSETVVSTVEENSDMGCEATDPGIVFLQGTQVPSAIREFAKKTIQSVTKMEDALKLIKRFKAEALGYGTGRGIIGALAAVGEILEGDYTYELIAYRRPENRGTQREVDRHSIEEMDRKTIGHTFNNVDPETKRILVTPRGPDPILYGIRGETEEAVLHAQRLVKPLEPVERYVLYRTNQGTDAHLRRVTSIGTIREYESVIVSGIVSSSPKVVPRRHRIFSLEDHTGSVDCAAYEPTGTLRKIAGGLIVGDQLEVHGAARSSKDYPLTINLEKIRICRLALEVAWRNPKCQQCGKSMKSVGREQGFKCGRCGFQAPKLQKRMLMETRNLTEGLFITSPRSQRHLTKPLCRYGREKTGKTLIMLDDWQRNYTAEEK
jgi:tRNA(Ile2)-agmatinylcytidine synthase